MRDASRLWPTSPSPRRSAASILRIGWRSSPARPKRPAARWTNGFVRAMRRRAPRERSIRSIRRSYSSFPTRIRSTTAWAANCGKPRRCSARPLERCEAIIKELELGGGACGSEECRTVSDEWPGPHPSSLILHPSAIPSHAQPALFAVRVCARRTVEVVGHRSGGRRGPWRGPVRGGLRGGRLLARRRPEARRRPGALDRDCFRPTGGCWP